MGSLSLEVFEESFFSKKVCTVYFMLLIFPNFCQTKSMVPFSDPGSVNLDPLAW
jgi:hypothetical protein